MNPDRTRIILADDHPFILFALRQLVAAEPDFELIGEAATGLEALSLVRSTTPDVAIIDVGMPKMNGYDTCRKIREQPWSRGIVIVALTGWGQSALKVRAFRARQKLRKHALQMYKDSEL